MSVATKAMTHFNSAAEQALHLIECERGLADSLFEALVALSSELESGQDLSAEFGKYMIDAETHVKASLDEGETLSSACGTWRNRKSEILSALKLGIDPTKYPNFSKFRKAAKVERDKRNGVSNPVNNSGGGAPNETNSTSKAVSETTAPLLHGVTSNLTSKVRDKLNEIARHIEKNNLDEATALKILQDCDGQIHKLAKAGGARFSNKRKTA